MGVLVTLTAAFSLLLLSGAVTNKSPNYYSETNKSPNYYSDMRGHANYRTIHVACSSNGSVVYISDKERVMRSKDFGDNWEIVMTTDHEEKAQP